MNRRELLSRAVLSAAAVTAGVRRAGAQIPPPRDTSAADPLYNPGVVQQRAVATAADNDPVVKELEHRLKCTCGCNLDIFTCRTTDFTCTYSPALHQELLDLRRAGKSSEEVVAAFVAKYGEQILMAPPPRGFNLAGYLVPGAAVAVAGAVLAAMLLRRSRRMASLTAAEPVARSADSAEPSAENRERLRRALDQVRD